MYWFLKVVSEKPELIQRVPWPFFRLRSKRMVNSATIVWTITEIRLNPGSLHELLKSYLILRNVAQTFPYGLVIWKAMQRNAWNDIANWRTEQLNSFTKWRLHALTTTNSRRRNGICRRIAPDRACDTDLVRLISRIPHTCEFKHYWQMGNTAQQCWFGLFQDCDFARDVEDSKSTSGGLLYIFGSHTFVPMSRMCKNQTSVSRSSTEAEVISLDAGSRMNGIPSSWSLGFDYCSVSVFTEPNNNTKDQVRGNSSRDTTWNKHTQIQTKVPIHHDNLELRNIDNVSSRAKSSQFGAMLYILKTAKKWLKRSSKAEVQQRKTYSEPTELPNPLHDTKHQLADILTKRHFTCDKWNNLLHLWNIRQPLHLTLLLSEFQPWPPAPKGWRKRCKNRKKKKGSWQSQNWRWTWSRLSRQVLRLCRIRLRRKAGRYWPHLVEMIGQVQENLKQDNSFETHRRVLKHGKKMQYWM